MKKIFLFISLIIIQASILLFSGCEKKENSDSNSDIPPLIAYEKGVSYSALLENLTANGYIPTEQTDTSLVFKGGNLDGIHPIGDFLTDYIVHSSKQITFGFDDNKELYMIKMEGDPDPAIFEQKSAAQSMEIDFSPFREILGIRVTEGYGGYRAYSCSFIGFPPGPIHRDPNNKVVGEWHLPRWAFSDMNIYPGSWWVSYEYKGKSASGSGIVLWFLFVPDNNPNTGRVPETIAIFETSIQMQIYLRSLELIPDKWD